MSVPRPLRVLVVGDPYMPVSAYADALSDLKGASLEGRIELSTMQIEDVWSAPPETESGRRLREYVGDPAEIAAAVAGHDALIVHGAPVTSQVLDAAPLRLVCCARGGPVNVYVAAANDRGAQILMGGRIGETIEFYYVDTGPLIKFVLESGSGHAIDLEPTYVYP